MKKKKKKEKKKKKKKATQNPIANKQIYDQNTLITLELQLHYHFCLQSSSVSITQRLRDLPSSEE